jgi:hypothetical protein
LTGVVLTNISLQAILPALKGLPDNLIKGFGEEFKFDYLEQDSLSVQRNAALAIGQCNQNATVLCSTQPFGTFPGDADSTEYKNAIDTAFASSLRIIQKVSNDRYFGTEALQETANSLNNITEEMKKIVSPMDCNVAIPTYCNIWVAADTMVNGVAGVMVEIGNFENGTAMQTYDDYVDYLDVLHAVPWVMVLGLLFYSFFWWGRALCCCCRGGKCCRTMLLVPHAIFVLLSFLVTAIFAALGFAYNFETNVMKLTMMRNEPTVSEMLDHVEESYPSFWAIVFKDLAEGLTLFWHASVILAVACIITVAYEFVVCCCRPYQLSAKAKEENTQLFDTSPTQDAVEEKAPEQSAVDAIVAVLSEEPADKRDLVIQLEESVIEV